MDNQRYFSRIKFTCDAQLEVNGESHDAELLDICLKGALLKCGDSLELESGDMCIARIFLPSSEVMLVFDAEVAHRHEDCFGLRFTLLDTDTLTHLRRLIELNLGNDEKVLDEMHFWLT